MWRIAPSAVKGDLLYEIHRCRAWRACCGQGLSDRCCADLDVLSVDSGILLAALRVSACSDARPSAPRLEIDWCPITNEPEHPLRCACLQVHQACQAPVQAKASFVEAARLLFGATPRCDLD